MFRVHGARVSVGTRLSVHNPAGLIVVLNLRRRLNTLRICAGVREIVVRVFFSRAYTCYPPADSVVIALETKILYTDRFAEIILFENLFVFHVIIVIIVSGRSNISLCGPADNNEKLHHSFSIIYFRNIIVTPPHILSVIVNLP